MALSINTNLFAINAQRNLRKSEAPLHSAMQRLSSGLRINSAKDDAAGLAIATRMTRQVNGLTVAMRNANDGVSFAQTAEGAMDEMISGLQRIYELAEQSASYNTSTDRSSMNQEVTELIAELNRTVTQTRYNGEQFLNQATSIAIQVGVEVNETISIATSNVSPDSYGIQASRVDFTNDTAGANLNSIASTIAKTIRGGLSNNATINSVDLGAAIVASDVANNTLAVINRVNQYTAQTGVTAFSFGNGLVGTAAVATTGVATSGTAYANYNAGYLTINGISIGSTTAAATDQITLASSLIAAINNKTTQTGVTAYYLGTADTGVTGAGGIALVNTTGAAITVSVATANAGLASSAADFFGTSSMAVSAGQNGQIVYSAPLGNTSVSIAAGAAGSDALALGLSSSATSISMTNSQSINSITVNTVGNANLAILSVKQGLETLNSEKAKLGAKLNRLESTIRNLDNVRENVTAARSRIMDADYAMETTNLTKSLIVQQAGISVLSQANNVPQQVLALLGR